MNNLTNTRRRFLKQLGLASVATSLPSSLVASVSSSTKSQPGRSDAKAASVVGNRAPLTRNEFNLLPLGEIRPQGWLRRQLQIQASGLSGHLDETWTDVGPESGWLGGKGESWERGPYYLDGLVPLAYLLDDEGLKAKAQKYIDWTLESQTAEGMIGPRSNNDWWPRMVMLKVLTQYQEATGDPRVIPVLSKYLAYQLRSLPQRPLEEWGKFRWQDEVQSVIWLYNRTGEPWLLDLAHLLHEQGYDWQGSFVDFKYTRQIQKDSKDPLLKPSLATHGVNHAQALKTSPVWSLVSRSEEDRKAIFRQLAALDQYHGLPNGMFSADEHLSGRNPSQGIELCAVVEEMFSLEQAMAILGSPQLGDRLERIAYNALPGTLTDDMWAHQYDQEPNQVECSLHHKPWNTNGPESNLFGLEPNFGCCTANYHQGWPKLTSSLWMAADDGGIVAAVYAPCEAHLMTKGVSVHLLEETDYPFRGTVRISVKPEATVKFPLRLRIPAWAEGTSLRVNGKAEPAPKVGSFAVVEREWKGNDIVEVVFPLKPRIEVGFNGSASVVRGPLVFSLPIEESWIKLRDRGMTADWQIYPASPWNYALATSPADAEAMPVEESPVGASPFALKDTAVKIQVRARKLDSWHAVDGVADAVPQSLVSSGEKEERITLAPYAAAKLRITSFPQLKG